MVKVREGLAKRKQEREAQENWFEAWFNRSPWLATLISTLVGPLALLLFILTFVPCILSKLIVFVKDHVSMVQLMVLRQQYERITAPEDEYVRFPNEHNSSLWTTEGGNVENRVISVQLTVLITRMQAVVTAPSRANTGQTRLLGPHAYQDC